MIKKGILSFLLAIMMIATSFTPVFAYNPAGSSEKDPKELSVKTVEDRRGNKKNSIEISRLEGTKTRKTRSLGSSLLRYALFANQQSGARSAEETWDAEINVNITKFGIGGDSFDWDEVFGKGETFEVQAFYRDENDQKIYVGTPQTVNKGDTSLKFTATLPKSATSINIETSFIDKIGIKAYERSESGKGVGDGKYGIDLQLYQIYNPVINVMWLNPYGTKVRGAGDAKASFNDVEFNIIDSNRPMNLRDESILVKGDDGEPEDFIDVQDLTDLTGKNLEVVGANEGKVTYGDKTYKVTVKKPTAKDSGEIKFIEQPKVITPGENEKPGDVAPEGYKRLSFHAESGKDEQDGLFEDNKTKLKIVDVLEGTNFNDGDLLKKIKDVGQPHPVINGKADPNKKFLKWNPALPTNETTGVVDNTNYRPVYIANGDKIDENEKLPEGVFKVKVVRDEKSIQADTLYGQTYAVFDGKTLAKDKFPELKAAANYNNPKWMTESAEAGKPMEKVDAPWTKEIKKDTTFKATAGEDAATQITENGGLKAVDITAFKGDKTEGKFWNKGVALNKENESLQKLLGEATVTDITDPKRTTAEAGEKVGTLRVTFKDGSTIDVQNQKLIVKDTDVNIDFNKKANDDANAPRHNDEVVKGTIKAANGVKVDGAIVEVKDSEGKTLGRGFANEDGTFNVGTKRPLKAGEDLSIAVTLPEIGKPSDAVTKKVGLNPDELNSILPTADKLLENLKGKPGISKDKLDKLEKATKAGKALIDEKTKKAAVTVPVTDKGQEQLDTAYANIKTAMEDLMENKIPMINGPDHKEIFVGDDIDLDKDVKVVDDNIKQVDGKDYSYKIYNASGAEVQKTSMVAKDGVYRVVYSAEDAQGVKASHTMTVVVKRTVVEVPGDFPEKTPEGYVKVEFKSGDNAGLNGVSKFLVKKDAPKSEVKEPTIIPKEGYKVADPKWSVAIPETFAKDFETEAQVLAKATTKKPADKDMDKYATLTFEAGDHGKFETDAKTTIYVLKNEEVKFNAPKVNAAEGFTFAGWNPELKTSYEKDTKHVAQYASNSDISDVEVKDFQEVKFVSGTDGNFGKNGETPITTKSFWVRPGKLVDLRTKAPKVTVTTEGKSHIGWDQDLVQTFTKADQPTVINAKYGDTVKKTEPDAKDKEKYAKVDFSAGNLGKIENNQTTTYWVVKDEKVTDTFKVPSVTANKGWKVKTGKDAWSPEVAESYSKDTIHVAQYDYDGASVVPQEPGKDKPNVPDKFVKVEFKKGDHGVISSDETFVYWVDPTKPVTTEFKAPKVIADTNYKHTGWNPALTKGQTFATATDIVAQYKSTVVTEDPHDANYVTVEFKAGDHGTLTGDAKFWVYKNEKVSITAPKVTAKAGYTFDKWDPAVKDSYAEATVHNATYTTNNNVSDTEVEGYNKVTFKPGDHGTLTEKSVWVKPDTLVDLTDKAPEVKPNEGYSHIGWKPALVGKFENNAEIVAQYSNSISDKPVEGWTEILFNSGEHGRFENGTKNTVWVNPEKAVALDSYMQGKLVPFTNYSFDKWTDAKGADADLATAKMYKESAQFTATYKSNVLGKDEYDKLPEDEKKNFVEITFDAGTNGKFDENPVNPVYVKKDVAVDLTEKAPTVIPNQGFGHSGWKPALKGTFTEATTITAQYKAGKFDATSIKKIMVVGPTQMGYGVGEKLNLDGLKVIAIDDAGLQKTYDGVTEIEKAGFTIAPANGTELTMDHNDKHIVVTKGEDPKKVTGETVTALKIHENKSAKAENVKALNQNEVDGNNKPTDKAKTTTTVTGKVKPGSTVVIKDEGGNDITPKGGVEVKNDGTFTAEVKKQDEGKKVQVIVTEEGKQPSEPADATVARDANNDGKADGDADQKTATPTAKALNQGAEPKVTTITGKAEPGAKVVAKVGETVVGETTADNKGDYTIEATKTGKTDGGALDKDTEVKVTAQVDKKLVSDPTATVVKVDKDGNGVADNEENFDIKKVTKVEVLQDPTKMDYLVKSDKEEDKVPFKTAGLVIKLTDSTGKEVKYTADELKDMAGIKIEPANDEKIGLDKDKTKLKVTVTGSDLAEKPTAESKNNITVKLDKDDSGIADEKEQTPEPTVTARNIGTDGPDGKKVPAEKTTVEIKTEPKAKVTIEYTDKDGQPKKIENLTAGEDGKLTQEITPKLEKDTPVKVTVQDGEKKPTDKTVKVFDDLDDNKIPDTQAGQTERPAALASNIGKVPTFTTITGEAEKGATVIAKVDGKEVGRATADSKTGKYTIKAKQNDAPIKQGVKVDVTATLKPKAESFKQTVVVFNDTDETGQPDSAKDFDVKKAKEMQVVASPDKMVYSDGDKLNLDGLKVLITDVNGNQKIFTYNNAKNDEFTGAGLSVDYKQNDKLTNADNNKKLTVTLDTKGNTQVTEAIKGQTPTALTVNKNQSAQPTDVVAANQKDETVTKVKGKAVKGAEVKITDADGNSLLPAGTTIKANDQGEFTADLNKLLDPGTKVFVTATEPGKSESPKAETTVIRDKDGDWKADTGAKLSTPVIDPIREKDEKVVVKAPKADDKIKMIEVSDQKGNTVTLTKDATGNTWTVVGSDPAVKVEEKDGKIEIPVKDKLPLNDRDQIKVTFKDGEKPANEAFDKAPVQKASQTPKVDPVYTGDKSVKIADPTVADPTAKTIKVKVNDNDSMTIEKQGDGSWKVKEDPNKEVKVVDGKVVVPLDPSAKTDDVIQVSTINDSGKASPAAEVKVKDKDETQKPTIDRANKDENSVSGKAAPGAEVTVTVTPKGGEPKTFTGKADGDGNYKVTTDPLVDGDTVVVKASEPDKVDSTSDPKVVGVDTSKLKDSIDKAEEIGGKDGANLNPDTNKVDKELKDALDKAKEVKEKGDNGDPNTDQKAVDKAKEDLDKAIAQKEADTAVDKAKDNPTPENIKDAQDKIDAIPGSKDPNANDYNPIKKDLQDKLDLIKIIKEAEKETQKEGYKNKPGKDRRELEKVIKEGKENLKNNTNITESTTKIEKALEKIRKESVQVGLIDTKAGNQSITITTYPSFCKVKIFINDVFIKEIETDGFGAYRFTLKEAIKSGDTIDLKAHKDGFNDDSYWTKVKE